MDILQELWKDFEKQVAQKKWSPTDQLAFKCDKNERAVCLCGPKQVVSQRIKELIEIKDELEKKLQESKLAIFEEIKMKP